MSQSSPETLFWIARAESATLSLSVKSQNPRQSIDLVLNLIDCMHGKQFSPAQFQQMQNQLSHNIAIDLSPIGCNYEDALAEAIGVLRAAVVLDRHILSARTSWLSGSILDKRILIVLDAVRMTGKDLMSVDVWSDMSNVTEAILGVIAKTNLGRMSREFHDIKASWQLYTGPPEPAQLLVTVSTNVTHDVHDSAFVIIDFQDTLSEELEVTLYGDRQQMTIPIDVADVNPSWQGALDEPFVRVFISDASWKELDVRQKWVFTWRDAIEQQILARLSSSKRFSSFEDFGRALHLSESSCSDLARTLFTNFCHERAVRGCASQRLSDHCARAKLLSGLVICFEPPRGLSGYLDMITASFSESDLAELGSNRTWRDHLSQIVNSASEFTPKPMKLSVKKRARRPGRPPIQLIPAMPLTEIFHQFMNEPENIVCAHCKFLPTRPGGESRPVL